MKNRRLYFKVLAPIASLVAVSTTQAAEIDFSPLDEATEVVEQTNQQAIESQEVIDQLADEARNLQDQFQTENDNLEALRVLNAGWRRQIAMQEEELQTIAESIEEVRNVTRELPLLMEKMVASMEQFIELDMPFHLEQRRQRIEFVRRAMEDPSVSNAERFRQILTLYQTENNYGRTHETYPATLELNGEQRDVQMLRVGRVALTFQTRDGSMTGAWDQENREWVELAPGEYRAAIDQAIDVSSGLVAPEILELPITAPESAQ